MARTEIELVIGNPKPRELSQCPFHRAVSTVIEIRSLDGNDLVRLYAVSFETMTGGGFVVELANIQ